MLGLENFSFNNNDVEKLRVATCNEVYYIDVKDIVRIQSISNYSKLFFLNGQTLTVAKLLSHFEEQLNDSHFSRIHRTHLVNLIYLEKYIRGKLPQIGLRNSDLLPVSRRNKKMLQEKMLRFSI